MAILFVPALTPAGVYDSDLASGAQWYFYRSGTTTLATVYTDYTGETPLSNPLASDGAGVFVKVYLDSAVSYRAVLKDTGGTTDYLDLDPYNEVDASISAAAESAQTALTYATDAQNSAATASSALTAVQGQTTGESAITFGLDGFMGDDEFRDTAVWNLASGWTYADSTDSIVSTTMKANRAIESVAGDGTTSQVASQATRDTSYLIRIRPSVWIEAICDVGYPAAFAGRAKLRLAFFKRDGSTQTGSNIDVQGTDYRSVANVSATMETLENIYQAPSDAYYVQIGFVANWPTAIASAGNAYFARPRMRLAKQSIPGMLSLGTAVTYTIAGGVITLDGSTSNVIVDTEAAGATDDLDTIDGGFDGAYIVLRTSNSARDVTVKDGTGNINLPADVTLSTTADRLILVGQGSNWFGAAAFSDNQ